MSVLVEACSVVVRRKAIEAKFPGGWAAFCDAVPHKVFCFDRHLSRVAFLSPLEAEDFLAGLESRGFDLSAAGGEAACVDQQARVGPPWLVITSVQLPSGATVLGCHLAGEEAGRFEVPMGWSYERSFSAKGEYLTLEELARSYELVARDGNMETWRHRETGKLTYTGRTGLGGPARTAAPAPEPATPPEAEPPPEPGDEGLPTWHEFLAALSPDQRDHALRLGPDAYLSHWQAFLPGERKPFRGRVRPSANVIERECLVRDPDGTEHTVVERWTKL